MDRETLIRRQCGRHDGQEEHDKPDACPREDRNHKPSLFEGFAVLLGEAVNAAGERVVSKLRTPEGYTLTAMTSLETVRRVLSGEV
ncbi:MAG TPA: hypothetical protein VMQ93_13885, partial [Novosphingobium sp.]|nr:hypothetical protein [Novosphingobium sp.]